MGSSSVLAGIGQGEVKEGMMRTVEDFHTEYGYRDICIGSNRYFLITGCFFLFSSHLYLYRRSNLIWLAYNCISSTRESRTRTGPHSDMRIMIYP